MKTLVLAAAYNTTQSVHATLIGSRSMTCDLHPHTDEIVHQVTKGLGEKLIAEEVTTKFNTRIVTINTVRDGGDKRSLPGKKAK